MSLSFASDEKRPFEWAYQLLQLKQMMKISPFVLITVFFALGARADEVSRENLWPSPICNRLLQLPSKTEWATKIDDRPNLSAEEIDQLNRAVRALESGLRDSELRLGIYVDLAKSGESMHQTSHLITLSSQKLQNLTSPKIADKINSFLTRIENQVCKEDVVYSSVKDETHLSIRGYYLRTEADLLIESHNHSYSVEGGSWIVGSHAFLGLGTWVEVDGKRIFGGTHETVIFSDAARKQGDGPEHGSLVANTPRLLLLFELGATCRRRVSY